MLELPVPTSNTFAFNSDGIKIPSELNFLYN